MSQDSLHFFLRKEITLLERLGEDFKGHMQKCQRACLSKEGVPELVREGEVANVTL